MSTEQEGTSVSHERQIVVGDKVLTPAEVRTAQKLLDAVEAADRPMAPAGIPILYEGGMAVAAYSSDVPLNGKARLLNEAEIEAMRTIPEFAANLDDIKKRLAA